MPDQPISLVHDASEEANKDLFLTDSRPCEETSYESPDVKHETSEANYEADHEATAQDGLAGIGPRGKKRKPETPKSSEKAHVKKFHSPPWKKFEPSNPTSFSQDGIRKSGRTNALPIEHQPSGTTRRKNAEYIQERSGSMKGPNPSLSRKRKALDEGIPRPSPKATKTESQKGHSHRRSFDGKVAKSDPRLPSVRSQRPLGAPARQIEVNGQTSHQRSGRSSHTSRNRDREPGPGLDGAQDNTSEHAAPRQIKTIRLNFRRPPPKHLPILSPLNVPSVKKFSSLRECFDQQELPPEEGGERPLMHAEIQKEAETWRRLEVAAKPGGVLHGDAWLSADVRAQTEQAPVQEISHADYLMIHIKMFVKELNQERTEHRKLAKFIAEEARAKWLTKQPKSLEAVLDEQRRLIQYRYKLCMKELSVDWDEITSRAKHLKLKAYEAVQQKKIEQDLTDLVGQSQSTSKLMRQKKYTPGIEDDQVILDVEGKEELASQASDEIEADSDDGGSDSDDSMTSSGSEMSIGDVGDYSPELGGEALYRRIYGDSDKQHADANDKQIEETRDDGGSESKGEELSTQSRPRYDNREDGTQQSEASNPTFIKSIPHDDHDNMSGEPALDLEDSTVLEIDYAAVQLDEVDDTLMDDDDDSESDSGTDVSEDPSSSDEEQGSGSDEDDSEGLMGFFHSTVRQRMQKVPEEDLMSPSEDVGTGGDNQAAITTTLSPNPLLGNEAVLAKSDRTSTTDVPSGQETPATTVDSQVSIHGSELESEERQLALNTPLDSTFRTPVPSLLRGHLRVYQHQGLDWLAGMYESDTNGILADEMGLGKTIQTIALLSHLATAKGIWGPHLIVVPTSVILNWEMEFKKFCPGFKIMTYYGNQEERREKRKGWSDDDRWHVCITSYQLALADQSSLKRRNWHYMVLDEAHNIKNFQSQRWQTLLTFKSHARLLLTGTPLQNNLTELWSLLFFLAPETDEHGASRFKDLKSFSTLFKRPVDQILDHGREALDDQGKEIVSKLHHVLRPHLLRRLKADVEKQMPKKVEHVVRCRLSKRQRQLYDGFMSRATTRESFASGNYMSIINCLMQLRKVCNHPDLFETRQIVTSYAMPKSAIAEYEIKELLVRRTLLRNEDDVQTGSMMLRLWHRNTPSLHVARARQLGALTPLKSAFHASRDHAKLLNPTGYSSLDLALEALDKGLQETRTNELSAAYRETAGNLRTTPIYPIGLMGRFTFERPTYVVGSQPKRRIRRAEWFLDTPTVLQQAFSLNPAQSYLTELAVRKFGCVTPAVVAPGMAQQALTRTGVQAVESIEPLCSENPFHEAQTRLSIAFPDRALIQYDCGKLQQLHQLLIMLQKKKPVASRCLIFTQMTKVLDILEQFLNLHGHRYLRLDGSTRIESRQALTDQFNNDPSILAFILSSRSGGLGINLTGADTVIFYDLDWNPAMDKQCQDRCHRIGQTRDVHIYRFVSDGTIEANILRKSNQKRMLDDVVIQEGGFDTEAFYRPDDEVEEADADAAAALDKVLGGSAERKQDQRVLDQVEDKEDVEAAREAQKEVMDTDEIDFQDKSTPVTKAPDARYESPRTIDAVQTVGGASETAGLHTEELDDENFGTFEQYMLRYKQWEMRDAVVVTMSDKQRKRAKKGKDHGIRIRV